MKFHASDFPLVRWNILAMCASLLISALVLYSSGEYAERSQNDRRNAQRQLNEARNRLVTAQDDQKNMTIYADEYGVLVERNIIGDDHRLDWMEGLENIRRRNLLIGFRYSIAPQTHYAHQSEIDRGNFDIHYSEMKLQLDVLHEGQLLDFFAALRSQIKGLYQLEGCTVSRASDNEDAAAAADIRLKAECTGGWITLKDHNAPQ